MPLSQVSTVLSPKFLKPTIENEKKTPHFVQSSFIFLSLSRSSHHQQTRYQDHTSSFFTPLYFTFMPLYLTMCTYFGLFTQTPDQFMFWYFAFMCTFIHISVLHFYLMWICCTLTSWCYDITYSYFSVTSWVLYSVFTYLISITSRCFVSSEHLSSSFLSCEHNRSYSYLGASHSLCIYLLALLPCVKHTHILLLQYIPIHILRAHIVLSHVLVY